MPAGCGRSCWLTRPEGTRYPTVEIRVGRCLHRQSGRRGHRGLGPRFGSTAAEAWASGQSAVPVRNELLRAATWRAARWGTERDLVDVGTAGLRPAWDLIDGLVEWITPSLEHVGDRDLVAAGLAAIRRRGTGAALQRESHAANGFTGLADAVTVRPSA